MRRGDSPRFLIQSGLAACLLAGAIGDALGLEEKVALETSQAAIGRPMGAHQLMDQEGQAVEIRALVDRPSLVSFIYTSCAHTCPIITVRLARAVDEAREVLGEGTFNVITVGFDAPADTPERMRAYARDRHIDTRNWYFLSGDPDTLRRFTTELGFLYVPTGGGFDHLAQVTVLDSAGVVRTQVYGDDFRASAIIEPLRQLLLGSPATAGGAGSLVERIRLLCTVYDPATGRYGFDYSLALMALTGVMSLGAILYFLVVSWRPSSHPDGAGARLKGLPR